MSGTRYSWLWAGIGLVLLAGGLCALAQGPESSQGASGEVLRAELRATQALYEPEGPLRLRFMLVNTSDDPLDIRLAFPEDFEQGVALPLQLVLGTPDAPAVTMHVDDELPADVPPPTYAGRPADDNTHLRLAPHGCVGADIDLRSYCAQARYPGTYRLEWRPLEGRLPPVSAHFRVEARKDAIIVTDYGKVTFTLRYDAASLNVQNFLDLVRQGFYDGKIFHRVLPGFVIQGGCPRGDGTGMRPDGQTVPAEFDACPVDIGTLLMARKPSDPDSASCQFFIALARLPELDGEYSVIGQASDAQSLKTLQQLGAVTTDRRNRPVPPVTIRSINLVDTEGKRSRRLELRGGRTSVPKAQSTSETRGPSR